MPSAQKTALNAVEPFDEWEDFALFASHYFLLLARSTSNPKEILKEEILKSFEPSFDCEKINETGKTALPSISQHSLSSIYFDSGGPRRFGSIISFPNGHFGHHGGMGTQARLTTTHVYQLQNAAGTSMQIPPPEIKPRMCHTITTLPGNSYMLVGGRTSPDHALSDCWLHNDAKWEKIQEIPTPLYRHCAVAVGIDTDDPGVLVFGGRSCGGIVLSCWFLWRSSTGWVRLSVSGAEIQRFGAVMSSIGSADGIVFGGMADDGSIGCGIWKWSIRDLPSNPSVHLTECDRLIFPPDDTFAIYRFGACLTWSSIGLLLIGGISDTFFPQKYDIMCLTQKSPEDGPTLRLLEPSYISYGADGARLLLIGHSVCTFEDSIVIAGGGAVCFSFGSYWNRNVLALNLGSGKHSGDWAFDGEKDCLSRLEQQRTDGMKFISPTIAAESEGMRRILRLKIETSSDFLQMMSHSQPFVLEGLDIGPCQREWSLDFLKARIGSHRSVRNLSHLSRRH